MKISYNTEHKIKFSTTSPAKNEEDEAIVYGGGGEGQFQTP